MTAYELADQLGVGRNSVSDYLLTCNDVVESEHFVATLKGSTVHIGADVKGLGGRRLLKDCRAVLARWFDGTPVLHAPVKHGNEKAVRLAEALGFHRYAATETHVWLMQTKEHFNVT